MLTPWRTSSRCGANAGCVQVRAALGRAYVRDSTRPCGPVMELTPTQWRALLTTIKETPNG